MDRTRSQATTLGQELTIAKAYLEIQATRMDGRLTYHINHDPSLDSVELPPLIVQPLLENAVKYAVDPREEGGNVWLSTTRNPEDIVIEVRDDGPGFDETSSNAGTGLTNVRQRLQSLVSGADLAITQADNGGVTATIRIAQ